MKRAALLAAALLTMACAGPKGKTRSVGARDPYPLPSAAGPAAKPALSRIYLGMASPQGPVDTAAFAAFLDTCVTPRFPEGLTLFDARGQWKGADGKVIREPSKVIEILHPADAASRGKVKEIAAAYKRAFAQEAVLVIESTPRSEFH